MDNILIRTLTIILNYGKPKMRLLEIPYEEETRHLHLGHRFRPLLPVPGLGGSQGLRFPRDPVDASQLLQLNTLVPPRAPLTDPSPLLR